MYCKCMDSECPNPHYRVADLEYGESVPGVTCPSCGGELVHTSNGAFCDWCDSFVPVVGTLVQVDDDEQDDSDWMDDVSDVDC